MRSRGLSIAGVVLLAVFALGACGSEQASEGDAGQTPPVGAPPPGETSIAGLYEVTGLTTELLSGDQRQIAGTLIMSQQGDNYTSTFSLRTMFPTAAGALPAEMIGKGEGRVDGRVLTGIAETQIVMSTVPGVDAAFAYVPRRVSQRVVSSSVAKITPDGKLSIEIRSEPVAGAEYAPTETVLNGELVSRPGRTVPLRP
jgi:hypothetical protein